MNKLGTVIGFTFMSKAKKKSFIVSTLIMMIALALIINVPYFIQLFKGDSGSKANNPVKIGLVYGDSQEVATKFKEYSDKNQGGYTLVPYEGKADPASLKKDIDSEKIKGYLTFDGSKETQFPGVLYVSKSGSGPDVSLQATLQSALQSVKTQVIAGNTLTDEQIQNLSTPVQIEGKKLEVEKASATEDKSENPANVVFVFILMIVFMMTNTTTGSMISSEVTSEKSSRIMEILITSVSPMTQMFGKIIGMFLIGILQIGLMTVTVIVNLMLPYNHDAISKLGIDLSDIQIDVFIYGLIFYVLGYFLFATLYAAIGSMVSRTEELGQAMAPMTLLTLAAFYVGMFSVQTPNSLLLKVCSYIPFVSPISMIVRIGLGDTPFWEIALSLGVLAASILVFGWLSAKIYRTGVLMYGKRPSFKELRKAMKSYNI